MDKPEWAFRYPRSGTGPHPQLGPVRMLSIGAPEKPEAERIRALQIPELACCLGRFQDILFHLRNAC